METQTKIKYIAVYLLLNFFAILLAFNAWWPNGANKFLIGVALLLGWIGILFLSIMVSRFLLLENDDLNFIGPLDLTNNEYYKVDLGESNARKFYKYISLMSFGILILTCVGFVQSMSLYKNYQLKNFAENQKIIIKDIYKVPRKFTQASFNYTYNRKIYTGELDKNNYKINDSALIIFSKNNPNIVEWQEVFLKSQN